MVEIRAGIRPGTAVEGKATLGRCVAEPMNQSLLGLGGVAGIGPVDLILGPAFVIEGVLVGSMLHGPVNEVFRTQTQSEQAEWKDRIEQAVLTVLLLAP